jgi:hypothetical protein
MIAHRGGYDNNKMGENTLENITFTVWNIPQADIEIDIYEINSEFVVTHDFDVNCVLTLEEVLRTLSNLRFQRRLFLDIKNKLDIDRLLELLREFPLSYMIQSFDADFVMELIQKKTPLFKIGFATESEVLIENPNIDYYVIDKKLHILYANVVKPVYWYTFTTFRDWCQFKSKAGDSGFIDYFFSKDE